MNKTAILAVAFTTLALLAADSTRIRAGQSVSRTHALNHVANQVQSRAHLRAPRLRRQVESTLPSRPRLAVPLRPLPLPVPLPIRLTADALVRKGRALSQPRPSEPE